MQPLYNRDGRAVAYIADNGISIYFYDGEPAGWIYEKSLVFAYSGRFLGWLMYGWLCDPQGNPAFFTDRSTGGPKRPPRQTRPIRGSREARPSRQPRGTRPPRPGMTGSWSASTDESFFAPGPVPGPGADTGAGTGEAETAALEEAAGEPPPGASGED